MAEQEASEGERAGMTNAIQMMSVLRQSPMKVGEDFYDKLLPYLIKLGKRAEYYQRLIGFTGDAVFSSGTVSTEPLDGSYLHGYYCMRQTFYPEDTVFQTTADLGDGRGFEKCPVWTAAGIAGSDGEKRFACGGRRYRQTFY